MIYEQKLIVNSGQTNLLNEIVQSLRECERFYFSVAFVNFSGLQLLLEPLKEARDRGVTGKIVTSTYLNFTEAKALEKIKEFKNDYYGVPHFKLYEQYQMMDAALLSNYRKSHSSFRGSGLLANGNDYFLFVDLHKEEGIEERLKYEDRFFDRSYFQWQTPNNTTQSSDRGKNIIFNKDRGIRLHLFVRKYREIDGLVEPYIYIGKGDVVEYSGERPITVKMKLENEVPVELYTEFTEMV